MFRSLPRFAFLWLLIANSLFLLTPESLLNQLALYATVDARWLYSMLSHMFMHAGPAHLIGNFMFVAPFALYMEHKLGPKKFLQLWIGTGVFAGLLFVLTAPFTQSFGAIGSSGACSGIAAAAMTSFGKTKSEKALGLLAFLLMFSREFFYALYSILAPSGVAYFAHCGGAIGALILLPHLLQGAKAPKAQEQPGHPRGAKKAALPAPH
jgi:membrane associated rhomboid family serine protease